VVVVAVVVIAAAAAAVSREDLMMRLLCFFDSGAPVPIQQQNGTDATTTTTHRSADAARSSPPPPSSPPRTLRALEEVLEDALIVASSESNGPREEEEDDNDEIIIPSSAVTYLSRPDTCWLHCKRPLKHKKKKAPPSSTTSQKETSAPAEPTASLLGISEETHGSQDRLISWQLYKAVPTIQQRLPASTSCSSLSSGCCCCLNASLAPHQEWTLQDWEDSPTTVVSLETAPTVSMEWIDLRAASTTTRALLPTQPAAICHFLRSLLGTDHASSPWGRFASERTNCTNQEQPELRLSDCVLLLVLDSVLSDVFMEFRVSDACPSFSLFSRLRLELLPEETPWSGDRRPSRSRSSTTRPDLCSLLVYRRLPPRERLSLHHPITHQPAPRGFLWEMVPQSSPENNAAATATSMSDPKEDDKKEDDAVMVTRLFSSAGVMEPLSFTVRCVAPPYGSALDLYPQLALLLTPSALRILQQEAQTIPQWMAWPEQVHYHQAPDNTDDDGAADAVPWTVFPLVHCFPANQLAKRTWIPATCQYLPQTVQLLTDALGDSLRTALFSRLEAGAVLQAHTGWQDLANYVLRVHIPLQVAPGGLCGTWVDGCVETHETGRPLCFDDSKTHRAFNYSTQERIVLIVDLERPHHWPMGTATGGHSEELDAFIQQMGMK